MNGVDPNTYFDYESIQIDPGFDIPAYNIETDNISKQGALQAIASMSNTGSTSGWLNSVLNFIPSIAGSVLGYLGLAKSSGNSLGTQSLPNLAANPGIQSAVKGAIAASPGQEQKGMDLTTLLMIGGGGFLLLLLLRRK